MGDYEALVREEIDATIDRAGFEPLDPTTIGIEVTDSFRRKLGECRTLSPAQSSRTAEYEIRIARRLFEDGLEAQWRDTVRHEVAHAYVFETVGPEVQPHGTAWKEAARRAAADPVARYEGDDVVDGDYVFACPNRCFDRRYVRRSKRIKRPGQYRCRDCDARAISHDVDARPADPTPGTCYVDSISR